MKFQHKILIAIGILICLLISVILIYRVYNHFAPSTKLLNNLDANFQKDRKDRESILLMKNSEGTINHLVTNNMSAKDKFYIASISELFTHSVIFKLADMNLINFDFPIKEYLPEKLISNILTKDGKDYSSLIAVRDLINQTSGLTDYEMDMSESQSVVERLKKEDFSITPLDAIYREKISHITPI